MKDIPLILVGHGSILPYNKEMMEGIKRMVERRGEFSVVEISFLQKNSPTLEKVLMDFVSKGVEEAIVLPVFLAKGVHTLEDIPEILKKYSEKIKLYYGDPMGADERIVDVLIEKAKEALECSVEAKSL
ncbi:MAG: CbiX/SirB N-terminal domain-containing protein [Candidatus Syntropharchaeia archaeon]